MTLSESTWGTLYIIVYSDLFGLMCNTLAGDLWVTESRYVFTSGYIIVLITFHENLCDETLQVYTASS